MNQQIPQLQQLQLAQNIDPQKMMQEIQTNPLLKLQMADPVMMAELTKNPDQKQAEILMEKKLKSIGLTDQEIAIVLMSHGLKLTIDQVKKETGLEQADIDKYYDGGMEKINRTLNVFSPGPPNTVLDRVKTLFSK